MGRRALILGTLAGQLDAVQHLQADGWTVFTCGHRREGPGVEGADGFFLVDILDVGAVTGLAERLEVELVYSVGSDIAMPTVARVSERLGLRCFHGVAVTDLLQRKDLLRAFLADHGLSPVRARAVLAPGDERAFAAFPAVLKPVDSQGQRGITVVSTPGEVVAALPAALAASRSGVAILEEWLEGPEVSVHVYVVDGAVRFFLPSDRHVWDGPMIGVPSEHALPARFLDEPTCEEIRDLVDGVVVALGVTEGPLYFQLKLTGRGPRIVEVASRLDGCHLWRLIEIHTGFDLLAVCFRRLAGGPWTDPPVWDEEARHVLRFYLGPVDRPFRAADHTGRSRGHLRYREFQVEEGALPRDANGVVARLGYEITEER